MSHEMDELHQRVMSAKYPNHTGSRPHDLFYATLRLYQKCARTTEYTALAVFCETVQTQNMPLKIGSAYRQLALLARWRAARRVLGYGTEVNDVVE